MLEKVMKRDDREGVQEVRAAFVLARKRDGVAVEEMSVVQMDHTPVFSTRGRLRRERT